MQKKKDLNHEEDLDEDSPTTPKKKGIKTPMEIGGNNVIN